MSKSKVNMQGMGLAFFTLADGRIRFECQRRLITDRRGKTSLRGVMRIGARPANDARRWAVAVTYPASNTTIAELARVMNQSAEGVQWRRPSLLKVRLSP